MARRRTTLTIRCSQEEAAILHSQAAAEHRTLSGCLLNILERVLLFEERYPGELTSLIHAEALIPPPKPRTKILLRCSTEQADRIRRATVRRKTSISRFVVFSLRRHWKAKAAIQPRSKF
ncbi:MAG TPA: hypothetical protein VMF66_17630 [Candidatus Acidoferrum sp.]|nr:hypothetical protein [Candidatus Acidoferrum sp.]